MALLSHSSDGSVLCGFTAVGVGIGKAKINEVPPETSWKTVRLCEQQDKLWTVFLDTIPKVLYNTKEMAILTRQGNTTVSIVLVHCMFA